MLFFSLRYDNTFDALITQMFMLFILLVKSLHRQSDEAYIVLSPIERSRMLLNIMELRVSSKAL